MALNKRQRTFIAAYARTGTLLGAAKAAKQSRNNHYDWQIDPEYTAAFAIAREQNIERLEDEVVRRAVEGESEIVMYQGQVVLEPLYDANGEVLRDKRTGRVRYSNKPMIVKRKSDNCLFFELKALAPERYRDNAKVELANAGGVPLSLDINFVNAPRPDGAGESE